MPLIASATGSIGKRIRVYWQEEEEWFSGVIQDFDASEGVFVMYDDGDERWEPQDQLMEFEDEEERSNDNDEPIINQNATRAQMMMMEPPASPSSYEDEYAQESDDEVEKSRLHEQQLQQKEAKAVAVQDVSAIYQNSTFQSDSDDDTAIIRDAKQVVAWEMNAEDEDDASETDEQEDNYRGMMHEEREKRGEAQQNEDTEEEEEEMEQENDDVDEQSIALSEAPITFARNMENTSVHSTDSRTNKAAHLLPCQAILRGKVLRAIGLPYAANIFVKVSYVEAAAAPSCSGNINRSSSSANQLMLRCKNILATTSTIKESIDPIWNEEDGSEIAEHDDGYFNLALVPPRQVQNQRQVPVWSQLRGDLLFSVHSAASSDLKHSFIGQAVLSLQVLLRELLGTCPYCTRYLELRSRSGKKLIKSEVLDDLEENEGVSVNSISSSEVVVAFELEPTYDPDVKQKPKNDKQMNRQQTTVRSSSGGGDSSSSRSSLAAKRLTKQSKAIAPPKTKHIAHSKTNRRQFEREIERENVAFAKRLEWKDDRRSRLFNHAMAQAKQKQTLPQHGAKKYDHKASSGINRSKFQQQVAQENQAMGKRLHLIMGEKKARRAVGLHAKHDNDVDFDRAYAHDVRERLRQEKDFLMEKAQAKYQQQNETVERVMTLQSDICELKTKVFALKTSVTRLDIHNKRDSHIRDCLQASVVTAKSKESTPQSVVSINDESTKTKRKSKADGGTEANNADLGSTKCREQREWELLKQEETNLMTDKQTQIDELKRLYQQEQELVEHHNKLQAQVRFVQAKQAFHQRMMKDRAGGSIGHQLERAMKHKQQLKELSAEDEEQWAIYQANEELKRLQLTIQVLKDQKQQQINQPGRFSEQRQANESSTSACKYLTKKIDKQQAKMEQLQQEQARWQQKYKALVVSGDYERLRMQVQDLQHLVFLCQMQAKHVQAADRRSKFTEERMTIEFQKKLFSEQTETEVLLKKK